MSDIEKTSYFFEKAEIKNSFSERVNKLYFERIGEFHKKPEYRRKSERLMYLRDLVISKGIEAELVDSLIKTAIEKTSSEYQYVEYNIPDIFLNP